MGKDCNFITQTQLLPVSQNSSVERPLKELITFGKTKVLKPGESIDLSVDFYLEDLAYFNDKDFAWTLTKGDYNLLIGNSSGSATIGVTIQADSYTKKVAKTMLPKESINIIKR